MDGRLDIALPNHRGVARTYIQQEDGSFTLLLAEETNLRAESNLNRATANFFFMDVNADGIPDVSGHDADGGASMLLVATHKAFDAVPQYENYMYRGCRYGRDNCIFAALLNDNRMKTISVTRPSGSTNIQREVRDILTNVVDLPSDEVHNNEDGDNAAATYIVLDVNNDSCPDIVNLFANGLWEKNKVGEACIDTFTWRAIVLMNRRCILWRSALSVISLFKRVTRQWKTSITTVRSIYFTG